MGYAPHTNVDVRDQLRAGITPTLPLLLGSFRHRDSDVLYEYGKRPDHVGGVLDLPHIIYMANGSTRFAHVRHTVAYIAAGEDEAGRVVLERWPVKSHRVYMFDWIMA